MKPVWFGRGVARALRRMPRPAAERIREALAAYAADAASRDVRPLKGEPGVVRLRVGGRRAAFVESEVLAVFSVAPGGGLPG